MEGALARPRRTRLLRGDMSEAPGTRGEHGATILQFPVLGGEQANGRPVAMAGTVELYAKTFPTRQGVLMLLQTWLFVAERDGVSLRQPEYTKALKRAISAVNVSDSVPAAISLLRLQEAALARLGSP